MIPCYNYAQYVGLAIDSVMAQSSPPFELIVVDDGSTDGSAEVIRSRPGVRYVRQDNAGHVAAFNHGYALSRGEVVWFLDADDVMAPGAIETLQARWETGAAKLQGELRVIDADGDWTGRHFCGLPDTFSAADVRDCFQRTGTYVWPVCSGNAYGREFLAQVMPLDVPVAPDGLLNTVAPLYGEVIVVPTVLANYRLHGANQSMHGAAGQDMATRFAKQIAMRQREFSVLRQQAERRGVALPAGDLLDQELVFVNYRLMLLGLGGVMPERPGDTRMSLWWRGMALLARDRKGWVQRLVQGLWFSAMALAPRAAAETLVGLRFNRAAWRKRLRRRGRTEAVA